MIKLSTEYEMEKKCGFGKKKRITTDKEIKKIFQEGKVYSGAYLKIYFLDGDDQKFSIRLQSHIKGGYRRNRFRRRLREIIRDASPVLRSGLYIIWGRKQALDIDYQRLKEDFEKLARGGDLWRN